MSAPHGSPVRAADVVGLLLGADAGGRPLTVFGAYLTEWDAVTRENTVSTGAQQFTDCSAINPAALTTGPVLMLATDAKPIILGRLYNPSPA
jgi:hypothetical protein